MRVQESRKEFWRYLRKKGLPLKHLDLDRGLVESVSFFKECRMDDVEKVGGDCLAFYCCIVDRGRGGVFEIGTIRSFRVVDESGKTKNMRLRLTFNYSQSVVMIEEELLWDPSSLTTNQFCHSADQCDELLRFARSTPAYQAVRSRKARSTNLKLENEWGVFG